MVFVHCFRQQPVDTVQCVVRRFCSLPGSLDLRWLKGGVGLIMGEGQGGSGVNWDDGHNDGTHGQVLRASRPILLYYRRDAYVAWRAWLFYQPMYPCPLPAILKKITKVEQKLNKWTWKKKECEYSPNRKGKQKESKSPNRVWKMWPDKKVISKTTM